MKAKQESKVLHMARIHPTAIVEPGAKIGTKVEIGPYSIIGANVEIGKRLSLAPM